ncbi:hypothetical protein [Halopseudomonas salegens]|uniref:Uncharacterized protein n=1 Tax=Halopseudomonas salegens TaxID=1434072 RepID=A0A1H2E1D2_9GAMM|nr:hypothetical protein [Halopseudomonas salegens]SDT88950.1 hypothetical protein SAMN05216210_0221 [Halopseudomonas salegens]
MNRSLGFPLVTVLSLVAVAFFALGYYFSRGEAADPLQWHEEYEVSLWQPLREQQLLLGDVSRVLGPGQLWMISAEGEPALVSRYRLETDGQSWRAQATVQLAAERMDSLVAAQDWQPDMYDQPLSNEVAQALKDYPIIRMSMQPAEPIDVNQVQSSFGNPDMRLEIAGGETWIYQASGAVVAVSDEEAHSVMFGLR